MVLSRVLRKFLSAALRHSVSRRGHRSDQQFQSIIYGRVTSSFPAAVRASIRPAARLCQNAARLRLRGRSQKNQLLFILHTKERSRKFSGVGFMLGGRCGSLAEGASLQGRLYGWRPREMALKAGYPRRQGPDVNTQRKISV